MFPPSPNLKVRENTCAHLKRETALYRHKAPLCSRSLLTPHRAKLRTIYDICDLSMTFGRNEGLEKVFLTAIAADGSF